MSHELLWHELGQEPWDSSETRQGPQAGPVISSSNAISPQPAWEMTPASEDWPWYLRFTLEMAETKNLTDKNNSQPIVCFYKIAIKQPLALPNKHGTNLHLCEVLFNAL